MLTLPTALASSPLLPVRASVGPVHVEPDHAGVEAGAVSAEIRWAPEPVAREAPTASRPASTQEPGRADAAAVLGQWPWLVLAGAVLLTVTTALSAARDLRKARKARAAAPIVVKETKAP